MALFYPADASRQRKVSPRIHWLSMILGLGAGLVVVALGVAGTLLVKEIMPRLRAAAAVQPPARKSA